MYAERYRVLMLLVAQATVQSFIALGTTEDVRSWFVAANGGALIAFVAIWLFVSSDRRVPLYEMTDEQLRREVQRFAQRLKNCDPSAGRGPLPKWSPLGQQATVARHIEDLEKSNRRTERRPRKYTDRMHTHFQEIVEELAERGIEHHDLTHRFMERPRPDQTQDLAATLVYAARKLRRKPATD